jgi:hypothetical protein
LKEEFNGTHPLYSHDFLLVHHNPTHIQKECESIKEEFGLISEGMELSYFGLSSTGDVNGGAWTERRDDRFNFSIAITDEAPDFIFEELIRDCVEEFLSIKKTIPEIRLGIEDEETMLFVEENYVDILDSLEWQ